MPAEQQGDDRASERPQRLGLLVRQDRQNSRTDWQSLLAGRRQRLTRMQYDPASEQTPGASPDPETNWYPPSRVELCVWHIRARSPEQVDGDRMVVGADVARS